MRNVYKQSVTARQIEENLERAFLFKKKNLEKPRFLLLSLNSFMAPRTYIPDELILFSDYFRISLLQ